MSERQIQATYDLMDVALAGDLIGGTFLPEVGQPVGPSIRVESNLDGVEVSQVIATEPQKTQIR